MSTYDPRKIVSALADGVSAAFGRSEQERLFHGRFSPRVAEAFVRAGIDAPERLLFMKMTEIGALKGIDRAALDEFYAYRARFDPTSTDKPQP